MLTFRSIIDQLDVWYTWRDNYNKFVPLFIEEAKQGKNWQDWNQDTFFEFFEKSREQCVASLQQGYFTNQEKESIRNHWDELAPMLQQIALSQDEPLFDVYKQIKSFIRKYTSLDRRAATNRLIASLQPKLLCTIVNEYNLSELFSYLSNNVSDQTPEFIPNDWFRNSYNMWQFYQRQLPQAYTELITFPWETYDYFRNGYHLPTVKNNEMSEDAVCILDLLKYKKQVILQGAPGTGKTYNAKLIAKELVKDLLENESENAYIELVQFHPSYSYEDFVRGIVVDTEKGYPDYINRNKTLGEFAKKAWENWNLYELNQVNKANAVLTAKSKFEQFIDHVQQEIDELGKFYLTQNVYLFEYDDIRFKYKGDNWEAHPTGLNMKYSELQKVFDSGFVERSDIKSLTNIESLTNSHATYYARMAEKYARFNPVFVDKNTEKVELKNYVLIIDEINRANLPAVLGELIYALEYRGESVKSMYKVDGDNTLILPPNLYIIGTMNTADRSVGQIDYAIRRRFAFMDLLPKILIDEATFERELFIEVSKLFISNIDEYIEDDSVMLKRSDYLSNEFNPEDVWIGHSYFIMKNSNREMRLKYEIIPILKEYIKDGILKESAREEIAKLQ